MQAHIPTLFLVIVATGITMAAAIAFVARGRNRSLMFWAAALALHSVAFTLFGLRGLISDIASIVLGNVALAATLALFAEGVFQFQQRRAPRGLIWCPVWVTAISFSVLLDNFGLRIILGSVIYAAQFLFILYILLQRRRKTFGRGQYILFVAAILPVAAFVYRMVTAAMGHVETIALTSGSPVQTTTFLISIISLMLLALGLLVMTKEHAEDAANQSQLFVQGILDSVSNQIAVIDESGTIVAINSAWRQFSVENSPQPGQLAPNAAVGSNYLEVSCTDTAADEAISAINGIRSVLSGHLSTFSLEYPCHSPQEQRWFMMTVTPLNKGRAVVVHNNITKRKQAEQFELIRSRTLELLASAAPLPVVLESLVLGVAQLDPRMLSSILLLDDEKHRFNKVVSPTLPDFYNAAINGLAIGPGVGSCGSSAFTGERVVVADIATHPYWTSFKELAAKASLGACYSQPIRSATGQVLGTFAIYHHETHTPIEADIYLIEQLARLASIAIERSAAAEKIRASEAHYRLLTEDVSDVVWKMDSNYRFTYISPADERMRGYRADEVIGHPVFELFTEEGNATVKESIEQKHTAERQHGNRTDLIRFEVQQRCKDGGLVWTEILSTTERDKHGQIAGYHGITRNISERKEAQEQVYQLAFFDSLTKLPNRRLFNDRFSQSMAWARREESRLALMFIDLDKFKPINDEHGHEVGDWLLQSVAQRIEGCLRATDTAARIGGDEFVVLLPDLARPSDAQIVAEKIRLALQEPLATPYHLSLCASASIGVALFPDHGNTEHDLLRQGDGAMYRAKKAGGNTVQICDLSAEPLKQDEIGDAGQSIIRMTWKASLASGNQAIDREHRELFRLTNILLGKSVTRSEEPGQFIAAFDALLKHVVEHFAHEEAILAAHGYELLAQHAQLHQTLVEQALELRRQSDEGHISVGVLVDFMGHDVVAHHILQDDRKFFELVADDRAA